MELLRTDGERKGVMKTLVSLVQDGILSVKEAAKRADMTDAEFEHKMATK